MEHLKTRENAHHILGMIDALKFGLIPLNSNAYYDCLEQIESQYLKLLSDMGLIASEQE